MKSNSDSEMRAIDYISTVRASELAGLDISTIRYLMRKGKIDGLKMGRDWWVNPSSLTAYINHKGWAKARRRRRKETQQPA
jgi:hypothetical protein